MSLLLGLVLTLAPQEGDGPGNPVDWARALILLHADSLSPDMVRDTLNVILKFEQDIVAVEPQIPELLHRR